MRCYVYKLVHIETRKFYIGSRKNSKGVDPYLDLGITYKSSSMVVKRIGFENFYYGIIEEFDNYKDCYEYEQSLIRESIGENCLNIRYYENSDVHFNNDGMSEEMRKATGRKISEAKKSNYIPRLGITNGIINKRIPKEWDVPTGFWYGCTIDPIKDKETRIKIEQTKANKSEEEKEEISRKMSASRLGKPKPKGFGEKVSNSLKGRPKETLCGENNPSKRPESREKISIAKKGKTVAYHRDTKEKLGVVSSTDIRFELGEFVRLINAYYTISGKSAGCKFSNDIGFDDGTYIKVRDSLGMVRSFDTKTSKYLGKIHKTDPRFATGDICIGIVVMDAITKEKIGLMSKYDQRLISGECVPLNTGKITSKCAITGKSIGNIDSSDFRITNDLAISTVRKVVNNTEYEILTPTGFQNFDGLYKKPAEFVLEFITKSGKKLKCTDTHRLMVGSEYRFAKDFKIGDFVDTEIGPEEIVDIQKIPGKTQVYDPLNVNNGHVYYSNGILSHNCVFQGSSYTLIDGAKIAALPIKRPTVLLPTLNQYYQPEEGHSYVITVDVSRGSGLDYSTFTVIDISTTPYRVACVFRDNTINTLVYPEFLMNVAIKYNNSFVLIETNDLGEEVANILYYELEYENVYMSSKDDIKEGGGKRYSPGCRTTKRTKSVGCDRLKTLVENDQLEINDANIIDEMSTFVRSGTSYKAEDNKHDDLMMCLVMFGFLTSMPVFAELFDFSLRKHLVENQLREVEDQMLPIGFVSRGDESEEVQTFVEPKTNTRWFGTNHLEDFAKAFG